MLDEASVQIAKSLNLPKKKLNIIKKAIRVYNSAPQTDQPDSGWSLDEMLMDGHTKTPDTEMSEADDLHQVLDLLDKMDKRQATVLRMRFGLDDEEPKTLKEIGKKNWNKRIKKLIAMLQDVFFFDKLHFGGGNSRCIDFDLPKNVRVVSNELGISGGAFVWMPKGQRRPRGGRAVPDSWRRGADARSWRCHGRA